jgi:sugar phosphate permease
LPAPPCSLDPILDTTIDVRTSSSPEQATNESKFFYGWTIVAVGFLAHIASAFSISSTLSVFLKPLSSDLGISRGVFSLIRSGEILIGAAAAPLVGTLIDRHGGRWLMAAGGLVSGAGFLLLGQSRDFWQFLLFRWLLISPGDALMGSLVVNVSISRWFVRMRGRALALAGMGHGLAKVGMPLLAASLIAYTGWRGAWGVFGLLKGSSSAPLCLHAPATEDAGLAGRKVSVQPEVAALGTRSVPREHIGAQSSTSPGAGAKRCALPPSGLSFSPSALPTSV